MIHQNPTHMMRGDGDEMGPAFPVHLVGPADQPQIELVQGRRSRSTLSVRPISRR
jgi:hypothetical protein